MYFWKKDKKKKIAPKKEKEKKAPVPIPSPPKFEPKAFTLPEKPKPYIPPGTVNRPTNEPAKKVVENSRIDFKQEFLKTFRDLSYSHQSWDVWNDFVIMAACAISNPIDKSHYNEREDRYLRTINKYAKEERDKFPQLFAYVVMALELNPEQDFLGELYIILNLQDDGKRQIFTPYPVCRLMSEVTLGNLEEQIKKKGFITVNDCCCGAGATLIAAANTAKSQLKDAGLNFQNHILFAAQDIDETVALMCYIQLSLLGVAAYIKVGDSLSDPIRDGDTTENYWFTPMYFSDVWQYRRIFRRMDEIIGKGIDTDE